MAAPKIPLFKPVHPSMPKAKAVAASEIGARPENYESALAELEQLASAMESGQLPLGEMLSGYRRASVLLDFCRQQLDAVEAQIRTLDDGQLKNWSPE